MLFYFWTNAKSITSGLFSKIQIVLDYSIFLKLVSLKKRWGKNTAVLDQCCFGLCEPVSKLTFRKRTRIIGSLPLLNSLSCRCDNTHVHQHVEGSVVWEGRSVKRSTLASEYPASLCASLAHLVHLAQSSGSMWRRSRVEAASVTHTCQLPWAAVRVLCCAQTF